MASRPARGSAVSSLLQRFEQNDDLSQQQQQQQQHASSAKGRRLSDQLTATLVSLGVQEPHLISSSQSQSQQNASGSPVYSRTSSTSNTNAATVTVTPAAAAGGSPRSPASSVVAVVAAQPKSGAASPTPTSRKPELPRKPEHLSRMVIPPNPKAAAAAAAAAGASTASGTRERRGSLSASDRRPSASSSDRRPSASRHGHVRNSSGPVAFDRTLPPEAGRSPHSTATPPKPRPAAGDKPPLPAKPALVPKPKLPATPTSSSAVPATSPATAAAGPSPSGGAGSSSSATRSRPALPPKPNSPATPRATHFRQLPVTPAQAAQHPPSAASPTSPASHQQQIPWRSAKKTDTSVESSPQTQTQPQPQPQPQTQSPAPASQRVLVLDPAPADAHVDDDAHHPQAADAHAVAMRNTNPFRASGPSSAAGTPKATSPRASADLDHLRQADLERERAEQEKREREHAARNEEEERARREAARQEAERQERERAEQEERERIRIEEERREQQRQEEERAERLRLEEEQRERERVRLEMEQREQERERLEQERIRREEEEEAERLRLLEERRRIEEERQERERALAEKRLEVERQERERQEQEALRREEEERLQQQQQQQQQQTDQYADTAASGLGPRAAALTITGPPKPGRALYIFTPTDVEEIPLNADDAVEVLEYSSDDWWYGVANGQTGFFPAAYVKLLGPAVAPVQPAVTATTSTTTTTMTTTTHSAYDDFDTSHAEEESQGQTYAVRESNPFAEDLAAAVAAPAAVPAAQAVDANTTVPWRKNSVRGRQDSTSDAEGAPSTAAGSTVSIQVPQQQQQQQQNDTAGAAEEPIFYARAKYPFSTGEEDKLELKVGDVIELRNMEEGEDWWSGYLNGREGWFPASYVEVLSQAPTADFDEDSDAAEEAAPVLTAEAAKAAKRTKRKHVVEEIIETERIYIDGLAMVSRGYMTPMRQRVGDLFDDETIAVIFSNIEQLFKFHTNFLNSLVQMGQDRCAECFVQHGEGFKIYATYCNNHTRACEELTGLMSKDIQMESFFEGCRLLVEKQLSLEGFLLSPVQRICRYPLLLKELEKCTDADHPDFANVAKAVEIMKGMANTINEEKRSKEEIIQLQKQLEGWEGPDIADTCTQLIHEGPLIKISGGKAQERYLYLFDNLFVYCKRTLKGTLQVKGKIKTSSFTVLDVNDDPKQNKGLLKHAFKINNVAKDKWYILCAKSAEEKEEWIAAFLREREKVEQDQRAGLNILPSGLIDRKTTGKDKKEKDLKKSVRKELEGFTLRSFKGKKNVKGK